MPTNEEREVRIKALKFIAKIIEVDTDMSNYPSTSEEVIDEAYELCERLHEEADEIKNSQALLDSLTSKYRR